MLSEIPYSWIAFSPQFRHSMFTKQYFKKEKAVKNVNKKPKLYRHCYVPIDKVNEQKDKHWIKIVSVWFFLVN